MFMHVNEMTPKEQRALVKNINPYDRTWANKVNMMSNEQIKKTLAEYLGQNLPEPMG